MEFGLFAEQTRQGASQEEAFTEMLALADAAEAGGLHPRSPEPGPLRLRDRPQRLPARVRRARGAVRREPGALLRGARDHAAQRLSSLTYDEILTTKVAFGTGPALVDRFCALRDELGVNGVAAELNPGGLLTPAQELRSLTLLMREVMLALR